MLIIAAACTCICMSIVGFPVDYRTHDHTVFTQHDRRVRLVHAQLVHFLNAPCCRPSSCGRASCVTCAVAKMRRDYSFVNDVETIDVKRQVIWVDSAPSHDGVFA
jgi:hypothetical protein